MNVRKALLSLLQLFAGFTFLGAALFFFSLPFLPLLRLRLSHALIQSPDLCFSVGSALAASSFVLLGGFYVLSRGKTLRIGLGRRSAAVEAGVIQKTLEECFKAHFPGQIALTDLSIIRGSKLEIEVALAPFEEGLREELFASVEERIRPLLEQRFGYSKPFCLIVKSK